MQAYKLVKEITSRFEELIESKISDGADGEVYLTKDDRVIKFVVYYSWKEESLDEIIQQRLSLYEAIKQTSNLYAEMYEYGFIGKGVRQTVSGEQEYLLFYYVTEKCDKITEDESKVFHSILSHEDANKVKTHDLATVKNMLDGMSYGLDFSIKKVINFYQLVLISKVKQNDIHPRNIMKSKDNFKFIDFDRCSIV